MGASVSAAEGSFEVCSIVCGFSSHVRFFRFLLINIVSSANVYKIMNHERRLDVYQFSLVLASSIISPT